MAALWSDKALRARLRHAGPIRASHYSWEATADRLHALLQDCTGPIGRRKQGRSSESHGRSAPHLTFPRT
jgi:hypothetical protein